MVVVVVVVVVRMMQVVERWEAFGFFNAFVQAVGGEGNDSASVYVAVLTFSSLRRLALRVYVHSSFTHQPVCTHDMGAHRLRINSINFTCRSMTCRRVCV